MREFRRAVEGIPLPAALVDLAAGGHNAEALDAAARAASTRIPVVVELDLAYRPLGSLVHLGVRRSPLRGAGDAVAFAARIADFPGLRFHGLMGYEAQIAGLGDTSLLRRGM